jgi:hypothetical protein
MSHPTDRHGSTSRSFLADPWETGLALAVATIMLTGIITAPIVGGSATP